MIATLPRHVAHSAYLSERRKLPLISTLLIGAAVWFTQRMERHERLNRAEALSDHLARDIGINTVRYDRHTVQNFPPIFF